MLTIFRLCYKCTLLQSGPDRGAAEAKSSSPGGENEGRIFLKKFQAHPSSCQVEIKGFPSVHRAILENSRASFDELLGHNNALEAALKKHKKLTVLDVAAGCGRPHCLRSLVEKFGGSPFLEASESQPLHLAVEANCAESLAVLLDAGADVEEIAGESENVYEHKTPLQRAAGSDKRINCLKILIKRGAHTGCAESTGQSALHIAIRAGALACAKELLRSGASLEEVDSFGQTPIYAAIAIKDKDGLLLLLKNGADPNVENEKGETPLGLATWTDFQRGMQLLCAYNADVNRVSRLEGKSLAPLHIACLKSKFCDGTPKSLSSFSARFGLLMGLPNVDVNLRAPNGDCCTPLHLLVKEGKSKLLESFIKVCRPNLEEVDAKGDTAVVYAGKYSRPDCLEILIKKGATVKSKGVVFHRVSDIVKNNTLKCITLLAKRGADLNYLYWYDTPSGTIKTTPLCRAIIQNKQSYASMLIKAGADIHFMDKAGRTALHYCAIDSYSTILKELLDRGAQSNIMQLSGSGDTPLHIAARKEDLYQIYEFVTLHGLPAQQNLKGDLPLAPLSPDWQNYVRRNCLKNADGEEDEKIDIHQMVVDLQNEKTEQSPEDAASMSYFVDETLNVKGCISAAMTLIQGGSGTWKEFCDAVDHHSEHLIQALQLFLSTAIMVNCLEAVQFILSKKKLGLNQDFNKHPFLDSIRGRTNTIEILAELIDHGADVNCKDGVHGRTPLSRAAKSGSVENVELLLEKGAEIVFDKNDISPVHLAATHGHGCVLELLLEKDKDQLNSRTKFGSTPFHLACMSGSKEAVHALLERGADVHEVDNVGSTAMHFAVAESKGAWLVEFLIEKGLGHTVQNKDGDTPMHQAVLHRNVDAVRALIRAGADIHARNKESLTPLYLACTRRGDELLEVLLDAGAEVDGRNTFHWETALHLCARRDLKSKALLLIKKGAALNARDNRDFTPLEVASLHGSVKVGFILLKRLRNSPGLLNRLVPYNDFEGCTQHLHFLDLSILSIATCGDFRKSFLWSLRVEERPYNPDGLPANLAPTGGTTRLHPYLDLVGGKYREVTEEAIAKFELSFLKQGLDLTPVPRGKHHYLS